MKAGSCWMLGSIQCHRLLLDLGYLACGIRLLDISHEGTFLLDVGCLM